MRAAIAAIAAIAALGSASAPFVNLDTPVLGPESGRVTAPYVSDRAAVWPAVEGGIEFEPLDIPDYVLHEQAR